MGELAWVPVSAEPPSSSKPSAIMSSPSRAPFRAANSEVRLRTLRSEPRSSFSLLSRSCASSMELFVRPLVSSSRRAILTSWLRETVSSCGTAAFASKIWRLRVFSLRFAPIPFPIQPSQKHTITIAVQTAMSTDENVMFAKSSSNMDLSDIANDRYCVFTQDSSATCVSGLKKA